MSQDAWEGIFSTLLIDMVELMEEHLKENQKKEIYLEMIDIFGKYSEDSPALCIGRSISYDEALFEKDPSLFDEYIEDLEEE